MNKLAAVLLLGAPAIVNGAGVVDWLTFAASADRTRFALLNDAGQSMAEAQIDLTAGSLAPLSPGAGVLQSAFWLTAPPFLDSLEGNASITTTKVQVAPRAGAVDFQLEIRGANLSGLIFAVGQLFGTGTTGTRAVNVAAKTSNGTAVPLDFLGVNSWDNGVRSYTQPLAWNGATLSLTEQADGESAFAFFQIPPNAGPTTEILFDIPTGSPSGSGDALEFAFGLPIPEPAVTTLFLLAFAQLRGRRRCWRFR